MFWAVRIAGQWLFRGPVSELFTDQIINQSVIFSGPWEELA